MRKIFILSVSLCAFVNIWAQDVIVTKKGEEISAKVEKVGDTQIKYKKFSHLSGPVYTLLKSEIFMIKYENGSRDMFNTNSTTNFQNTDNTVPNIRNQSNVQDKVELLEVVTRISWSGVAVTNRSGRPLSKNEVRSLMATKPEALSLYDRGLSNAKTSSVWGWATVGCLVGGTTIAIAGGINAKETGDYTTAYFGVGVLLVGTLGCLVPCAIFSSMAQKKIDSAVDIYNSEVIKRQQTSGILLDFGITPSGGIGFVLNY